MRPYDPDPMRASLPLDPDEVDGALAFLKAFTRDRDAVVHLLRRAADTLRAERDTRVRLGRELSNERTLRMARPGGGAAMNPLVAAQYLTPEQVASLQQGSYSQQLRELVAVLREIDAVRAEHQRRTARARLALEELTRDPVVGARVAAALDALPALPDAPAVPRQALNLAGAVFSDAELDQVAPLPAPAAPAEPASPAAAAAPAEAPRRARPADPAAPATTPLPALAPAPGPDAPLPAPDGWTALAPAPSDAGTPPAPLPGWTAWTPAAPAPAPGAWAAPAPGSQLDLGADSAEDPEPGPAGRTGLEDLLS